MASITETRFLLKILMQHHEEHRDFGERVGECRIVADHFEELGDPALASALRACQFSIFRRKRDNELVATPFTFGPIGSDVEHVYSLFLFDADRALKGLKHPERGVEEFGQEIIGERIQSNALASHGRTFETSFQVTPPLNRFIPPLGPGLLKFEPNFDP
jgi:hypothetical protein